MMESELLNRTIKEAMRGDRDAFAELYRNYAKTIYFHTCNYVWDRSEAEDVAQDVVVQMLKTIGSLRSPYAFTSWMHQVIRSVCHNYNDRYVRNRSKDEVLDAAVEIVDVDERNNPAEMAEALDAKNLLYVQIEKLPEMQRTALIMHYYDEMKHREIAKVLGVKEVTVSTNIMKAKKKLKEILENDKRFGGTEELLGSVLMVPAIKESLNSAADKMMPPVKLEQFCDACAVKVQAGAQAASAVKTFASSAVKLKIAIGAISAVAVVGSSFYAYEAFGGGGHGVGGVGGGREASQFVPNAEIVLQIAEGGLNATNPLEASLVMGGGEGTASGWSILSVAGDVVASGSGVSVTEALQGLSPGEYSIRWAVVKGEAEAIVKRTFFVE